MAVDFFNNDDEENQDRQDDKKDPSVSLGGDTGVVTGSSPTQGPAGGGSGSFTNLNAYLDANRDQNFGSQVAGKVQGRVNDANTAQDKAESDFKSRVDTNSVAEDPTLLDEVKSNPEKIASNDGALSNFFKMRDASYAGPKDLTDTGDIYSPVSQAVDEASQEANLSQDEGGRKALLDQYYGSGNGRYDYNVGMKNLDNLLIQNDPSSREAFQKAQTNAGAAKDRFSALNSELDNYAAQKSGDTAKTRADTRAALGIDDAGSVLDENSQTPGALQDILKSIDQEVQSRKSDLATTHNALDPVSGKTSVRDLSPDQLSRLGINPADYGIVDPRTGYFGGKGGLPGTEYAGAVGDNGALYGVNPGKYLDFTNDADLTRGSVGTTEQQAKLNALSKLAGVQNSWIPPSTGTPGAMAEGPLSNFKKSDFDAAEKTARDSYTKDAQDVMKRFDAISAGNGLVNRPDVIKALNDVRAKYGLLPLDANGNPVQPKLSRPSVIASHI